MSKAKKSATPAGVSSKIDCYVKLPTGRTVSFDLQPSDEANKIYSRVADEEGVSIDRVLIKYTGKVINRSYTLGYLGVCKETILKAEIIAIKQWSVFVKLGSGETVSVRVENVSPVRSISERVEEEKGIPTGKQILKISGRRLTNLNEKCMDAGITDEAVLTLTEAPTPTTAAAEEAPQDQAPVMDEHDKEAVLSSFDAGGRPVEVVFSFDTTGSMYSCLTQVKDKLKDTVTRLIQQIPQIRVGIVAHGDYCDYDTYVLRQVDLTADVDSLVTFVNDVPSTSGGDCPEVRQRLKETVTRLVQEVGGIRVGLLAHGDYIDWRTYVVQSVDLTSDVEELTRFVDVDKTMGGGDGGECYEWVLREAQTLDWSEHAAKALVIIGDDVPHVRSFTDQRISWQEELDVLKGMGVKVYGVRADHGSSAEAFYQELAERTGGAYITFSNFSIIADMFLAVCYKEAGDDQFAEFCEEVEQEAEQGSSAAADVKQVLAQIEQSQARDEQQQPQRYVAAPWWDVDLDNGTQQYEYVDGKWRPYTNPASAIASVFDRENGRISLRGESKSKKRSTVGCTGGSGKKCSIM